MENKEKNTSSLKVMHERDIQKVSSSQKVMKVLGQIMIYTFLGIMALIVLFPFYFMIISSLKSLEEYYTPNEDKALRVYMFRDSERLMKPSFILYENGTFQMTFAAESSYIGIGTYTLEDGRLTLKTDDGSYTYCFDSVGNTYVFDAESSSDMVWLSDMTDGCVFE